jgi:hypothetical protein
MLDAKWAHAFAREWIDAWNSHDLERVLSHYADEFEMTSPLVIERMGEPTGVLRGKAAVRPYWSQGLAAQPPLRFELLGVSAGVRSIAIQYRSVGRRVVTEVLQFDTSARVVSAAAHWAVEVTDR